MNAKRLLVLLTGAIVIVSGIAFGQAQGPLEQPLANFDKLISNLKVGAVVGQPIQSGETTIVPFAKVTFGLGGGGAMMAFGGGMGGKAIPLGILIIEGEDVRVELFPEEEKKPSFLQEMLPILLRVLPQIMGERFSLGQKPSASAPKPGKAASGPALEPSLDNMKKLFAQNKYEEVLEMADVLLAKDPNDADLHVWKGNAMGRLVQENPANMMKYGLGAVQEYETALQLDPQHPGGHFGRGMTRLYMGNLEGAVADLEFACDKDPFPEAFFYLGEAYKKQGADGKARAAYKKALELKPDYAEAANALAAMK
jgi:uncharacterized spore protein YtfJ/Flp pilus assembly protein TadD